MPAVPDEPMHLGRSDRHDEARSRGSACSPMRLRPYRVVKRYRGDRQATELAADGWAELWRIQVGDVSWPDGRVS